MLKKEASKIVGGLSTPGKMPCYSINLPAWACKLGSILAKISGTTCYGCYALKNRYIMPIQQAAMIRRLKALTHGSWTAAMITLITGHKYFRWHDSGDLQSVQHLKNIFEVCKLTPDTMHWLPTQERQYLPLNTDSIPKNLLIRLSNAKNDTKPGNAWDHWSTVVTTTRAGHVCPAPEQGNECGSCRNCWNKEISNVAYPLH